MNSENGKIGFSLALDDSELKRQIASAMNEFGRMGNSFEEEGDRMDAVISRIAKGLSGIAAGWSIKEFTTKVAQVRGEFQQLEIAFETMLGSSSKANELMNQLTRTAAITPFDLQGVAQGAKQLLAYGTQAEEVNETLTRLGDIAAGLSIPLGDLVYLYGTTMTQGRLFTQDLRQFMGRGIPLAEELAAQFEVTKDKVGELVTAGKVGAEEVKQAIWSMTNEGSKFGGLMEKQSASITGQISNIEDAFDSMFNEIGKQSEGAINTALSGVSYLVENYEEVGSVLLGLVAAYGEYKAALMVTSALHNTINKQVENIENTRKNELYDIYGKYSDDSDIMAIGQETATEETNTQGVLQNTASREGNVTAIDEQIAALERKMLADIEEYDKIMESAQTAIDSASKKEDAADKEIAVLQQQVDTAKDYLDMCNEDVEAANKSGDAQEIETAKRNYNTAATQLESREKALASAQTNKETAASEKLAAEKNLETAANRKVATQEKLTNMQKSVSVVQTKAQTTATGVWIAMMNGAKNALNSLKVAIASNPFGIALAAITTVISLLPMFSEETSNASAEIERFGENAVKQTRNLETLMAVVDNTSATSQVHKDSVEELCKIYEEYGFKIDSELDKLEQLKTLHDQVTEAIQKEGEERQKANLLASYEEALGEATTNMRDALQNAFSSAEWDESGIFDDWDAEEYQDKAKELTSIVGSIIQSESESLTTLTGDALEAKITEVKGRIEKAYTDMGLNLTKSFVKGDTYIESPVDVDVVQIMRDYAEATHSVTEGRKSLIESWKDGKASAEEEKEAINYSTMSVADLAKAASQAAKEVKDLNDTSASPEVDKKSIEAVGKAANETKNRIDALNGLSAKPIIDATSIGLAIDQTTALLDNMLQIGQMGGGKVSLPKSFSLTGQKSWFGWNGLKTSSYQVPYTAYVDSTILAQNELQKRVTDANTQKKVDDLLKEVKEAMENAVFDSAEYKQLESLKKQLEGKSRSSKSSKKSNSAATESQKLEDLQANLEKSRLRALVDMENKVADARIAAMAEGEEKVQAQQEKQNKAEIEALERQKEDAIQNWVNQEKNLFEQQEKVKKAQNANYKEQKFDKDSVDTSLIEAQYDELIRYTMIRHRQNAEKEALDSMRNYLKEYGSFEQQRLAVTEEYEEKIAKATTEGEKLSLQKERDQKLGAMQYDSISSGIDWRSLFSGVGTLSKDMMQPMMDKLVAYTKTDDYLKADSQTQQDVASLIQELRQYLGSDQSVTWETLGTATDNFMNAVARYNQAVESEKSAIQKLEQAESDLKNEEINKDEYNAIKAEVDSLGEATAKAKNEMEDYATKLNDASEQVANFTSSLTAALNNAKGWANVSGFSEVKQSIAQIDSFKGALDSVLPTLSEGLGQTIGKGLSSSIGDGLSTISSGLSSALSSGLGQTVGFLAQIPQLIMSLVSSIKSFVTGILNTITEIISLRWIDDLVNSILDAVGNLINAIFDLPENLFHVLESIVVDGVGGLLNTVVGRIANIVSFGALSSDGPASWFTNSNAKKVAEAIENLTDENKKLEQSIQDLTDAMEGTRGAEAIDISSKAADLQRQTDENYLAIAQAQAGYHNAHHSWNYYWDGYSQEEIDSLSAQIGRSWNGDIWDLSPEEMKRLRSNIELWEKITDTGKGDYGERVAEKLNDYIEQAGKLEEITDTLYENLTTTTSDNVFDDFLNSLYDLADGSEDVFSDISDAWQEMVNKMVVNNLIGAKFQKKLETWYEDLAKLNESKTNGELTDSAYKAKLETLKSQYEGWVKDAQSEIDLLRNEGIITSTSEYSQEASDKGFQTMSQDTADELNGRFTAIQMDSSAIRSLVQQIAANSNVGSTTMTAINSSTAVIRDNIEEMRNLSLIGIDHLETISKNTHELYEMNDRLAKIEKNTRQI